jgi:isocitrate/isopropylmalate dehydrogenase
MPKKKIVALGGDGVGPEVMDATCWFLDKIGFNLDIIKPACGAEALKAQGNPFPEEALRLCEECDAILFGAAERPSIAILVYLRWVLDNYINLRPVKYYPGARSPLVNPEAINFCIIRENSEGLYPGREGDLSWLAQRLAVYKDLFGHTLDHYGPGKFALRLITEKGTERIARYALDLARQRKASGFPGKVTCITKSNVLFETCGLFRQTVEKEMKKDGGLTCEHYYVDDAARRIVRFPQDFDVIVTSHGSAPALVEPVRNDRLARNQPNACQPHSHDDVDGVILPQGLNEARQDQPGTCHQRPEELYLLDAQACHCHADHRAQESHQECGNGEAQ